METINSQSNLGDILKNKLKNTASRCLKFIGSDKPLKIQTTNAQEVYNHYQVFKSEEILILDFRSKEAYEDCHFLESINIPHDAWSLNDFLSFSEKEFSNKYWLTKDHKDRFKLRKRSMVIFITFEQDCEKLIPQLPFIFDKKKIRDVKDANNFQDVASLRNAILMQKVLANERNRNCYLSKTSMQTVASKYKFMWKFKNASRIMIPLCTAYPSEVLENCLYLSNAKVAKNEWILQTLGFTHILNVSDWIPNYFENDGHILMEYANIDVEDVENARIGEHFEFAYNYIDRVITGALSEVSKADEISGTKDELNKNEIKSSKYNTNTLKLDLSDGTLTEWNEDEHKRTVASCDMGIAKMHSNNKNKLLVHWAMGKSRSATIVIMYIMKKFQLSYKQTYELVKERRHKIDINTGFVEQLKEFERNNYTFLPDVTDLYLKHLRPCLTKNIRQL
jgi:protein-tyrosine phosphatase